MNPRFFLVVLAGFFLVTSVHGQPPATPRTDSLGDALPKGAIARVGTLRFKHEPAHGSPVTNALFSPDGKWIASMNGQGDATIRLWDAATGKQMMGSWNARSRHSAVAFSPDGKVLALAWHSTKDGAGANITLWDIATAKELQTIGGSERGFEKVQALAFAERGKTLIMAGNGTVRWWDIAAAKEAKTWQPMPEDKKAGKGKAGPIRTIAQYFLSPDGKLLVVQSGGFVGGGQGVVLAGGSVRFSSQLFADREITGFDLATSKMQWKTRSAKSLPASWIAFSADSKRVGFSEDEGTVKLQDAANGKLVAVAQLSTPKVVKALSEALQARLRLELDGGLIVNPPLATLAVSPDGNTLALCGSDGQVSVWNQADPASLRKLDALSPKNGSRSASAVAFSPDGKRLLVGAGTILKVYDVATLTEAVPLDGHQREVAFVAFSPDGKHLLTSPALVATNASELLTWDTSNWKLLPLASTRPAELPAKGQISPDQSIYLGITNDNRFGLYDPASGKQLAGLSLPNNQNPQGRAYFSPDSKFLVIAGKDGQGKDIQHVYRVPSGKLVCELPPLGQPVETLRPVAFSADGRMLALFTRADSFIHVFELKTGTLVHHLGKKPEGPQRISLSNLTFSFDGKLLASWTSEDNVIRVWDTATGKERFQMPFDGVVHNRLHLAWSPDSRMLAVGDRKVVVWELATRRVRCELDGHQGDIRALAFSPDGRLLASGSTDTTALVWDLWGK